MKWTHFPLHPETPPEGRSLADLFRGRGVDIPQMLARMKQVAAEEGLSFGDREYTYNSRLAQELGAWAETQGKGDAFHHTAFHTYFAEGKNIAQESVLLEMAESAGLSTKDARNVLDTRSFKAAVDQDWTRSREMGITAVPTFLSGFQRLTGAQPYEALEKLMAMNRIPRR